jgi:hypothetical protein
MVPYDVITDIISGPRPLQNGIFDSGGSCFKQDDSRICGADDQ